MEGLSRRFLYIGFGITQEGFQGITVSETLGHIGSMGPNKWVWVGQGVR
jgi:hypothetical protein